MSRTLIQFSAGHDLISWLVCQRTACLYSHCDFLLPSGELLGALPDGGVQVRAQRKDYKRLLIMEVPGFEDGWKFCETQIGTPYDWVGVVGLGMWFPRQWQNSSHWWCSEIIAESLQQAGCPVVSANSWEVTPRDLLLSRSLRLVESSLDDVSGSRFVSQT